MHTMPIRTAVLTLVLSVALGGCQSRGGVDDAATSSAAAPGNAAAVDASATQDATLAAAIAATHRSEANRARDRYRHPQETLAFFGIKPSMSVIEITPGLGWYTEILAPWLGVTGQYYAAVWDNDAPGLMKYYRTLNEKFDAVLAARPDLYGGVKRVKFDPKNPDFDVDGGVDAIVTFRNVHNWAQDGRAEAFFKAFHAALKPGGVLGVVEHRAHPGTTLEASLESGYLSEAYVIGLATAAGFVLEAKSEVNANPKDTKDYEAGVWALPPTLGLKDKDREKYLAIGESDRMTLRFRKPDGDTIHSPGD
jgi:predicted methyltransferase